MPLVMTAARFIRTCLAAGMLVLVAPARAADDPLDAAPTDAADLHLDMADASQSRVSGPPALPTASASTGPDAPEPYRLRTFGKQAASVGWELAGITAAITATRVKDVTKGGASFRFKDEGWFGRDTESLGMDKLHHAWKTYVLTDVLQSMIENRTGDRKGAAYTSALLGLGVMTYAEVLDGFTARTGFSNEDTVVHVAGAALSVVRNAVPGLREKIDFRMQFKPAARGDDLRLVNQLAQRKYLIATQLSGFKTLERTPWRFVELHAGYYARGFTEVERARGDPLRRKIFVGVGLNIQQLFARNPRSRVERLAKGAFDYVQLPYTSVHN
jgi:hypothetical protein